MYLMATDECYAINTENIINNEMFLYLFISGYVKREIGRNEEEKK